MDMKLNSFDCTFTNTDTYNRLASVSGCSQTAKLIEARKSHKPNRSNAGLGKGGI